MAAAEADRDYRCAKAKAYLKAFGTVAALEAQAAVEISQLRFEAKLAEDLELSALEAVRSRRSQLSATQSLANAVRAEAELARVGPGA